MSRIITKAAGYCDLNIKAESDNLKERVLEALELGYQTVAINTTVTDTGVDDTRKEKDSKGSSECSSMIPPPTTVTLSTAELQERNITQSPIILTRLTVVYADPSRPFLHKAKQAIEQYDLVAFTPLTEAALKQVSQTLMYVDIISFDITNKKKWPRKIVHAALERDIYFELQYGPCIGASSSDKKQVQFRKTVELGFELAECIRSHNVFVSSGASAVNTLRAPHDVANLARFFGLSLGASICAVSSMNHDVVYCASQRRLGSNKCNVRITFNCDDKTTDTTVDDRKENCEKINDDICSDNDHADKKCGDNYVGSSKKLKLKKES
uniref:Ribonuclease P protein subunit drpp30-like n=1 Tax=Hirondellea gigas TaxID=1518452 RepID=A0A6A7FXJ5_9CRUS